MDETRNAEHVSSWPDPATFVETISRSCPRAHWVILAGPGVGQEGRDTRQARPVLERCGATFSVMHASTTAVYRATEENKRDRWPKRLRGRWRLEVGRKAEARITLLDVHEL